ncbi:MAG: hypothetical protein IKE95_01950 [Methanobrevibacter sp.]|nr:hypothetical protein [Methanobrevibacter sp.]
MFSECLYTFTRYHLTDIQKEQALGMFRSYSVPSLGWGLKTRLQNPYGTT